MRDRIRRARASSEADAEAPLLDKKDTKAVKQLSKLLIVPKNQAMQLNNAVYKFYPTFTKIYLYKSYKAFKDELLDPVDAPQLKHKNYKTNEAYNLLRSLRRTKTTISDLVLCNEFDLFATFTFAKDRYDIDRCKRKMSDWLDYQRRTVGRFSYLIVPEFHKDGALHFHALLGGYRGHMINSGKTIGGRSVQNFKSYRSGFSSCVRIDDHQKVSSYIKKYITKDMPQIDGQKRFWVSRGLIRPRVERGNIRDPIKSGLTKETRVYENQYLTVFQIDGKM